MEISLVISLVVGVVSIVLALVAIWHSTQSERKSTENYNRTKDVLAAISEKAAVIEGTVNNTQEKLVDTITDIARPKQETHDEMLMKTIFPTFLQNPQLLERLIDAAEQSKK